MVIGTEKPGPLSSSCSCSFFNFYVAKRDRRPNKEAICPELIKGILRKISSAPWALPMRMDFSFVI